MTKRVAILFALMGWALSSLFAFSADAQTRKCCRCVRDSDPKANICIQTLNQEAPDVGGLAAPFLAAIDDACLGLEEISGNHNVRDLLECKEELEAGECQPINEGGVCQYGPNLEEEYRPPRKIYTPGEGEEATYEPPELGVKIPGLIFSSGERIDAILRVPWFAQYISAIQNYLIGIAIVAAAVMLVYGGFRYILGSAAGSVSRGKEIIADALIGLGLVLGAYLILYTINPRTVEPAPLDVRLIHRQDAFSDPAQELARVVESARIKPTSSGSVEVPVINRDEEPFVAEPTTAATPTAALPPVGEIAKNAKGELVAQGNCPIDMVPIPETDAYKANTGRSVRSFCIDRFEAPNQRDAKPILGITEWEAEWYCNERGKRLCTQAEWTRACLGPRGENTYGYGKEFKPGLFVTAGNAPNHPQWYAIKAGGTEKGICNYDTPPPRPPNWGIMQNFYIPFPVSKPEFSILNPDNPRLSDASYQKKYQAFKNEIDALNKSEPSGSRPQCVTEEGVVDMPGNVSEMVVRNRAAGLTTDQRIAEGHTEGSATAYIWMGFYWAPVPHKATSQATPTCDYVSGGHSAGGWRDYAIGFRCCLDLND